MPAPCKAVALEDGKLGEINVPCMFFASKLGNKNLTGNFWHTLVGWTEEKAHPGMTGNHLPTGFFDIDIEGWYRVSIVITVGENYNTTPDAEFRMHKIFGGFGVIPFNGWPTNYSQTTGRDPTYSITDFPVFFSAGDSFIVQARNFGGSSELVLASETGIQVTGPWP